MCMTPWMGDLHKIDANHDALFLPNVERTPSGMASQVNAPSKNDLSSVYERSRIPYNSKIEADRTMGSQQREHADMMISGRWVPDSRAPPGFSEVTVPESGPPSCQPWTP